MASSADIAELRRLADEPDSTTYSDTVLSLRLDGWSGTVASLAGVIWREKAAALAGLVDVREGNSDRKLSQLYKQALAMADAFTPEDADSSGSTTRRGARTRPIERQ